MDLPELPDSLWVLPPAIANNSDLVELYEVMRRRLIEEVSHLPLNTIQQLLVERVAYNYIDMRWREVAEIGYKHERAQKDLNSFWLDSVRELNKQLREFDITASSLALEKVGRVISDALRDVEPDVADAIRLKLAGALEEAGL